MTQRFLVNLHLLIHSSTWILYGLYIYSAQVQRKEEKNELRKIHGKFQWSDKCIGTKTVTQSKEQTNSRHGTRRRAANGLIFYFPWYHLTTKFQIKLLVNEKSNNEKNTKIEAFSIFRQLGWKFCSILLKNATCFEYSLSEFWTLICFY